MPPPGVSTHQSAPRHPTCARASLAKVGVLGDDGDAHLGGSLPPEPALCNLLHQPLTQPGRPTDTAISLWQRDSHPPTTRWLARGDLRADVLGKERRDDSTLAEGERDRRGSASSSSSRASTTDTTRPTSSRMPERACAPWRSKACASSSACPPVTTSSASTRCSSSTARSWTPRSSLADGGTRVVVSGLDQDFRRLPFGVMPELLAHAEFVDKLQAVCRRSGGTATTTQRLVDGGRGALLGRDHRGRRARFLRGPVPRVPRGGGRRDLRSSPDPG